MKTVYIIIFFVLVFSPLSVLHAQNDFAILEKNINVRAKGLTQKLNTSKDTLILQSNTLIKQVYAVNMNYKREVDIAVSSKSVNIPLSDLSAGKHVFVAVQSPMRIVFVVKIFRDDVDLLALESDKLLSKNENP